MTEALEYGRGRDKVWVFGALRVEGGKSLTCTSRSRNSEDHLKLLQKLERDRAGYPKEAYLSGRRHSQDPQEVFAYGYEIDQATRVATRQLNRKASPWVLGRPPKSPRLRRREFV